MKTKNSTYENSNLFFFNISLKISAASFLSSSRSLRTSKTAATFPGALGISHYYPPRDDSSISDKIRKWNALTDLKAHAAITKTQKDFCGLHYISESNRVKYLRGVLPVQPEESGTKFLLGNSTNNPANQKPVIVPADILKHAFCLVEATKMTSDCVFSTGETFSKSNVDLKLLGRFIPDKKRILPLF